MNRGDRLRLTIERPAAGGRMIARHEGAIVFVSGGIPGEIVEAEVEKVQRGTTWAVVRNVVERSPDRVDAPDGACGGSVFAHIAYDRQRAIKAAIVDDSLRRLGKIQLEQPVDVVASPVDGYRMRARLHVRGGRIGFFREGTHSLCDPAPTRQLRADTIDVVRRLETSLSSAPDGLITDIEISENVGADERAAHLTLHPDAEAGALAPLVQVDGLTGASCAHGDDPRTIELRGSPFVADRIGSVRFERHARSFFQGNRFLIGSMVDHVLGHIASGAVLDLYAGVGLFSVSAAAAGKGRVTAVEGDRFSSADLKRNAQSHGVTIKAMPVEQFVMRVRDAYATIVVDPPRTGVSKDALTGVINMRAPSIVYVSCDVATLARDARMLIEAGYRITSARAFDLFPNTAHVETVIAFSR